MIRSLPVPAMWMLALALMGLGAASVAQATTSPPWQAQVRAAMLDAAQAEGARRGHAVRTVEVLVGDADPRLRLAPCARTEATVAPGLRAWGRTRAAVRCTDGATRWSISVPVTVRALGPAVVVRRGLAAGDRLVVADLDTAEVDLAEDASPAVARAADVDGRTLARSVATGRALRVADLQARRWFDAGDTVRIVARGPGFAVHGTAQALNPGVEGQVARVRTDNGRILNTTPVGEREVEIAL
jgi:flagella basal body P-ring formation protein FlgA